MEELKTEQEQADYFFKVKDKLTDEIHKIVIGQDEVIRQLLISIFTQGHSLLVGVPGLAKTLLIKTISEALDLSFNRIQFTPDLMPSDITGSETLDQERNFKFIKGPIFANIILADEINRTPPKTQSALLESMQEYSVTIGGKHYPIERPFFVLATQNPIEQEGTYPLPEAQLDRFLFNIKVDYPTLNQEMAIVKATTGDEKVEVNKVIGREDINLFQHLVRKVPVTDNVIEYAVKVVNRSRPGNEIAPDMTNEFLEWGAGPRASQFLILAAKCNALFNSKYSPDIEDVKQIALPIMRHRILRNFKAEAEGVTEEQIVEELLKV